MRRRITRRGNRGAFLDRPRRVGRVPHLTDSRSHPGHRIPCRGLAGVPPAYGRVFGLEERYISLTETLEPASQFARSAPSITHLIMFVKVASIVVIAAAALSANAFYLDSCIINCSAAAASAAGCSS